MSDGKGDNDNVFINIIVIIFHHSPGAVQSIQPRFNYVISGFSLKLNLHK